MNNIMKIFMHETPLISEGSIISNPDQVVL